MRVAIIDYGSGNLRSATKAFERAAREAGIEAEIDLTDRADRVATADRIVLPGVGDLKIPQMGWNTLTLSRPHPLFDGIATGAAGLHAYFVHSYHLAAANPEDVIATADYGGPVTAFVARGNKAGSQFHPEKSQTLGLALITNFLRWKP